MPFFNYKSTLLLVAFCTFIFRVDACTNLMVGKQVSEDGSVILSYSADAHTLYGELYHWQAATWSENSMLDIYDWDSGKYLGKIPQVKQTYAVVGNMNEFQLTIAESTFGGREELINPKGIMDYGSLIYVTLQRARNAREAIRIMAELVEKHGYYSSGESFSIADPNELWVMEMIGKGPDVKGAVWVAVRIPDDCISAHANQARIRTFPLNDKDNCVFAPDVISFAREKKYFDGLNKDFSFADTYCPLDYGALRSCEARVWSFFRRFNPDMDAYLSFIKGESKEPMPLYIRPQKKISVQDIKEMMRDHFEGTELDMTKDIGAGPFGLPYRWRPLTYEVEGEKYLNERAIATQQTGFSFVAQMRNWLSDPVGGVLWFGVDDAATAVYTPIYCGTQKIPYPYQTGNGSMSEFSWNSFFWINNWVANMAYSRYDYMMEDIRPVLEELETFFNQNQELVDQMAQQLYTRNKEEGLKYITEQTSSQTQYAFDRWKTLGEFLLVRYIDGNIKKVKNGEFEKTPEGHIVSPDQPGYNDIYYRNIVKESGEKLKMKKLNN